MRVGIVGSRHYGFPELVRFFVRLLPDGTIIVSGGAENVDTIAEIAGRERGFEVEVHKAEWGKYPGKSAAFYRNKEIAYGIDALVAFWDGVSKGTKMTLDLALERNKERGNRIPIIVYRNETYEVWHEGDTLQYPLYSAFFGIEKKRTTFASFAVKEFEELRTQIEWWATTKYTAPFCLEKKSGERLAEIEREMQNMLAVHAYELMETMMNRFEKEDIQPVKDWWGDAHSLDWEDVLFETKEEE